MEYNISLILGIILSAIFGMGFGSFITMAIYRLPIGMNWIGKKTRCISCDTELKLKDFMPIFSWYLTKGRCRYCNAKIETRLLYLLVEIGLTILTITNFLIYGFTDFFIIMSLVVMAMVTIIGIEANGHKIHSKPMVSLLVGAILYRMMFDNNLDNVYHNVFLATVIGIAVRAIYLYKINKKHLIFDFMEFKEKGKFEGLVFQYIKLLIICSIFFNKEQFFSFIFISLIGASFKFIMRNKPIMHLPLSMDILFSALIVLYESY